MSYRGESAGRFARQALEGGGATGRGEGAEHGEGEVCAVFRRSFYLRSSEARYACIGDRSLGNGPLNVLVNELVLPGMGQRVTVCLTDAIAWQPPPPVPGQPSLEELARAARNRVPAEGLGGLIIGAHNALSNHAQPALDALERWLAGNALDNEVEGLIGLGPGLTPSGDDYLGGMLVALRLAGRAMQAEGLWRWLQPRLEARTSALSAAHLAAAASGEAHQALHEVLNGKLDLDALDAIGHTSGWDALAGAAAVMRLRQ